MATKNNPGQFDCYANADADEPMFVLLGRDAMAPSLVESWAYEREIEGEDAGKVEEARQCATSMREWLTKLGKKERPISTDGSHVWEAEIAHGICRSTVYVATREYDITHAIGQLTAYASDEDQFLPPGADILSIKHLGPISA